MTYDIAILGGGLLGTMSAYELCQTGLSVVVIDKGSLGGEATAAAGGILSSLNPWLEPSPAQALYRLSQQLYPQLCQSLLRTSQIDPDYAESGMLFLQPERDQRFDEWYRQQACEAQLLSRDESSTIWPAADAESLWMPRVARVDPGRLLSALTYHLQESQVRLLQNTAIKRLQTEDNRVTALVTEQGDIEAQRYVLAAGAWSDAEAFNVGVQMKPMRGQMIEYMTTEPLVDKIILHKRRYCVPRGCRLVIGSTLEDAGFDATTTATAKQQLMSFAASLFPALEGVQPQRHWAGLRPDCGRDRPYIGRHAWLENLFLNTGHFRNGILAAPASARLLRELMTDQQPSINGADFAHTGL